MYTVLCCAVLLSVLQLIVINEHLLSFEKHNEALTYITKNFTFFFFSTSNCKCLSHNQRLWLKTVCF